MRSGVSVVFLAAISLLAALAAVLVYVAGGGVRDGRPVGIDLKEFR